MKDEHELQAPDEVNRDDVNREEFGGPDSRESLPELLPGDADFLKDMLNAGLDSVPPPKKDVLAGVQKRLRTRSKGKFYGDGWSTREENPRSAYLITAALMLLMLIFAYVALVPAGVTPLR